MHTIKKYFIAASIVFLGVPVGVFADEIQYGFIESIKGSNEIHVKYKGPGGEQSYSCNITSAKCKKFDPKKTPFRSADAIELPITFSPGGEYGIMAVSQTAPTKYVLVDINKSLTPTPLPVNAIGGVRKVVFSRDSSRVVFIGNSMIYTYDIKTKKVYSVVASAGTYLSLVSPSGRYITSYSDSNDQHQIIDLQTGKTGYISSGTAAYLEISQNGKWGAFRSVESGRHVLKMVTLSNNEVSTLFSKSKAIEDYIFHDDRVYFTANARTPLTLSLYEYDPVSKETKEIDSHVSYGDYIKSVGKKLAYYKVIGNDTHVHLYSSDKGIEALLPIKTTELSIQEKEIKVANRSAVLWDDGEDEEKPLVIWLHGGPQRQTSLGYHSYLSYAVYDELLERLVGAGARVVKFDYMGSTGYGKKIEQGLIKKIGVADVEDVTEAIEELTDEYETDGVYLIGNSYGGYLGLKMVVEEPKRIDGVVSINGVTDWKVLIERIPGSIFAKDFGGVPGPLTNKYYKKADIISHLDDVPEDTPIAVVYGTSDTTIPPIQSKTFIEEAKKEDKNVITLELLGEEHVLRKRKSLDRLCDTVTEVFDLSSSVCDN